MAKTSCKLSYINSLASLVCFLSALLMAPLAQADATYTIVGLSAVTSSTAYFTKIVRIETVANPCTQFGRNHVGESMTGSFSTKVSYGTAPEVFSSASTSIDTAVSYVASQSGDIKVAVTSPTSMTCVAYKLVWRPSCPGCASGWYSEPDPSTRRTAYDPYKSTTTVTTGIAPHHIDVSYVGTYGTTCEPLNIILKSCDDASCSSTSNSTGSIAFSPDGAATVSESPITFSGTKIIQLTDTTAGNTKLAVTSHNGGAAPTCKSATGACTIPIKVCGPHHLRFEYPDSGVTCEPSDVTVKACADESCSSLYTKVTPTATLANVTTGTSLTPTVQSFVDGKATFKLSHTVAAGGNATWKVTATNALNTAVECRKLDGSAGSMDGVNCTLPFDQSALKVTTNSPKYAASAWAALDAWSAGITPLKMFVTPVNVRTGAGGVCMNSVRSSSGSASVSLTCAYANPTSSVVAVYTSPSIESNSVQDTCSTTAAARTFAFDADGMASRIINFNDVGQVTLSASLTSNGAVLSGTTSFITVPYKLKLTPPTAATALRAGKAFTLTVGAFNYRDVALSNFGKEVPISPLKITPGVVYEMPDKVKWAGGSSDQAVPFVGELSGTGLDASGFWKPAFSADASTTSRGTSTATDGIIWSEVGTLALAADLPNGYLGATLAPTTIKGETTIPNFLPDSLRVETSNSCVGTGITPFTFAGEPIGVTISALNGLGNVTRNFDKNYFAAKDVTLKTSVNGAAALTAAPNAPQTVLANTFTKGVSIALRAHNFTAKTTSPLSAIRWIADWATTVTPAITSNAQAGTVDEIRALSGRIFVGSATGMVRQDLAVPMFSQFYKDNTAKWVTNTDDICTGKYGAPSAISLELVPDPQNLTTCIIESPANTSANPAGLSGAACKTPQTSAKTFRAGGVPGFIGGDFNLTLGAPSRKGIVSIKKGSLWPLWLDYDELGRAVIREPFYNKNLYYREAY